MDSGKYHYVCRECNKESTSQWPRRIRCPECALRLQDTRVRWPCADCGVEFFKAGIVIRCQQCQIAFVAQRAKEISKLRKQKKKERCKKDPAFREKVLAAERARHKKWLAKNPDKRAEQKRRDREKNRERVRQYKREYDRRTRAANPVVRLVARTRSRIAMALRAVREGRAVTSKGQAFQLLGCTVEHFVRHLESQFADGMTWETFAGRDGWHVDHIYPIAAADLADEAHRLAVFNWRNCRPQWGVENLKKGATVTDEAADLFQSLVSEFKQRLTDAGRAAG